MRSSGEKIKERPIDELVALRKKIADLKASEAGCKQVQEALQQREDAYLDLLENANDLVQSVTVDGRFLYVNRRWRETLGYTEEEISRLSLFDIIHPDSQAHCAEVFQQVISGGSVDRVEAVFVTKDGKKVMVEGSANCRFVDGKPDATRGIFRDITERKEADEALRREKERAEGYLNIAGVILATVSADENITLLNKKGCEILGYKDGELIGKNWFDTLVPERVRDEIRDVFRTLVAGNIEPLEYYENPLLTKGGEERLIAFHITVIRDTNGQIVGVLFSAEDVTKRKRMEGRIEHLNQLLRASYNVSHLIARERDPDKLLRSACDTLIESRVYRHAWLVLLDVARRVMVTAESGLGKDFSPMAKRLKHSELTICGKRALKQSEVVVIVDPLASCADCPLAKRYEGMSALTVRLEHNGKVYGLLSCSVPNDYAADEEELSLFQAVARDVSFALHNIETEKQRQRAVNALAELAQTLCR